MRSGAIVGALIAGVVTAAGLSLLLPQPSQSQTGGRTADSVAAFTKIATVLTSPRCQNCHTLTNFPRQGDDRHPHRFNVTRGSADHGAAGLSCAACHGRANNTASGVPGADEAWRLAPLGMGWDDLSTSQLCRHLKDPQHNGHRSGAAIIDHLRSHLVMWAWSPGVDRHGVARTPPPIPYADFMRAAQTWVTTGAACPQ
jgi:hypothetical protein